VTTQAGALPRFSIITPAFDAEAHLGSAIESVLRLDVADWELIVVDDGSRDRTAELAGSYDDPRIRLVRQPNLGQSAAQNRGLSLSQGTYVSFLDSDDCYRPDALSRLHEALRRHPSACLAYGAAAFITQTSGRPADNAPPPLSPRPSGQVLRQILARNFIVNGATVLAHRESVLRAGGFDARLVMAQDWDLWCRLALQGEFVFAGHVPVVEYRLRADSVARTHGMTAESQFKAIDAVFTNAAIRATVPPRDLVRLRRMRTADAWLFVATEALRARNWSAASRAAMRSIALDSRPLRTWATLGCALMRHLPAPARRRLGVA
jgi:glycosyltransferase involved in cell wall biosynthesis